MYSVIYIITYTDNYHHLIITKLLNCKVPIISVILYRASPSSSIRIACTEFTVETFVKSSVDRYKYLKP